MLEEFNYKRRQRTRPIANAIEDMAAVHAGNQHRRMLRDPTFRAQYSRYLRFEITEQQLRDALEDSLEREKQEADMRLRANGRRGQ